MPARICIILVMLMMTGMGQVTANDLARVDVYDPVNEEWHQILVEIAETLEQRQMGLMYRQFLPIIMVCYFYMSRKKLSFWMKNTFISLDIIYFSGNGDWINTAHHTTPQSLDNLLHPLHLHNLFLNFQQAMQIS